MKRFWASLAVIGSVFALAIPLSAQQSTTTGTITLRGTPAVPARVDVKSMNGEEMKKSLVARFEKRFEDADGDGDGSLSKEEYKKMNSSAISGSIAMRGQKSQQSNVDSQNDQRAKLSEEQRKQREKLIETQFDDLDENDDGKITKEEYVDARTTAMSNALGDQNIRQKSDGGNNSTSTTSTRAIRLPAP